MYLVRDNPARLGGGGEIRTHDTLSDMTVFKTVAFNRSATPPRNAVITILDLIIFIKSK